MKTKSKAAKAKRNIRKKASKVQRNGKTAFIADLIRAKDTKGEPKWTARQIADKVVAKYPEKSMTAEAQLAKALRFVRAVPWHMAQKGEKGVYRSAYADKAEKPAKAKKTTTAKAPTADVAADEVAKA